VNHGEHYAAATGPIASVEYPSRAPWHEDRGVGEEARRAAYEGETAGATSRTASRSLLRELMPSLAQVVLDGSSKGFRRKN
jgi:hypothetical protein